MVLKCFCDTVILDDFKTALDRLRVSALTRSKYEASTNRGGPLSPEASVLQSFRMAPVKTTIDIEKAGSEIELTHRSDPSAIYVKQTVAVEEVHEATDNSAISRKSSSAKEVTDVTGKYWSNITR